MSFLNHVLDSAVISADQNFLKMIKIGLFLSIIKFCNHYKIFIYIYIYIYIGSMSANFREKLISCYQQTLKVILIYS